VGALAFAAAQLAFVRPAWATGKDGYRGIPAFVQVTSVEVTSGAEVNRAVVCYRLSSAVPAITLRADAAERFAASRPPAGASPAVGSSPAAAGPGAPTGAAPPGPRATHGGPPHAQGKHRPHRAGVRSLVLDSTIERVEPAQLAFFSSIPRFSGSGAPRQVTLLSQRASRLEYPGFERLDFCEATEFEKALGPSFIKSLFESPFLLGDLTGTVTFRLELVEERERPRSPGHDARRSHGADRPCSRSGPPGRPGHAPHARACQRRVVDVLSLSPADHVVPVFGKNASITAEQLTIEAAAASNAALFMDSGMPPDLVAGEGDAALNDTLLATFGVRRDRPSGSGDCRRFLGVLREAAVTRRLSAPRPEGDGPRSGTERAGLPAGGAR
jgi:hypothetical protein